MKDPIKLFQKEHNLVQDGKIGKLTFGAMTMAFDLSPIQLAHFLGQCYHESGGFKRFEESFQYSKERLLVVFKKYYTEELALKHEYKPSVIANHVYGNRMGNKEPNDGWMYRGRGVIQLTGRSNYKLFSDYVCDPTIMTNPKKVAEELAFKSGLWYFKKNSLDELCEDLSVKTITTISKGINLGNPFSKYKPNGLDHRIESTLHYKQFIT